MIAQEISTTSHLAAIQNQAGGFSGCRKGLLMDRVEIWRRLAATWRQAAEEVVEPALQRCYAERATSYDRLISGEDEPDPADWRLTPPG